MKAKDFKEARLKLGFTQRQLAAEWGMGDNGERTLRRWEHGERSPNPIAVYCIGKMLEGETVSRVREEVAAKGKGETI